MDAPSISIGGSFLSVLSTMYQYRTPPGIRSFSRNRTPYRPSPSTRYGAQGSFTRIPTKRPPGLTATSGQGQ
ncbi:hypothetical protein DL766_009173 [Monosporascus sp. MC13-8B]|nr:hypothetical protein DL763_002873 [Monosporascus cannonballus]RYP16249.1 hypothetical protein DL766_009173 [Monosporascus sp. MC13-8B]